MGNSGRSIPIVAGIPVKEDCGPTKTFLNQPIFRKAVAFCLGPYPVHDRLIGRAGGPSERECNRSKIEIHNPATKW